MPDAVLGAREDNGQEHSDPSSPGAYSLASAQDKSVGSQNCKLKHIL